MTQTRFDVPQISCEVCKASLEGVLLPRHGVQHARVDVETTTVTVTYEPHTVDTAQVIETIESQGYNVRHFIKTD